MVRSTSREGKSGYIPKKCSVGTLSDGMMIGYVMVAIWFILVQNITRRRRRYLQSRGLAWLRYGISAREKVADMKLCSTGKVKVRKQKEANERMTREIRLTLLEKIAQSCCFFLRIHSWGTFWWNAVSVPCCDPDSLLWYLFISTGSLL